MGIETAIIGAGILGAGASYLGSKEQAGATEAAANLQSQYGTQSIEFQREMFNKLLELQQPYYNVGTTAINPYLKYLGLPQQRPQKQPSVQEAFDAFSGTSQTPTQTIPTPTQGPTYYDPSQGLPLGQYDESMRYAAPSTIWQRAVQNIVKNQTPTPGSPTGFTGAGPLVNPGLYNLLNTPGTDISEFINEGIMDPAYTEASGFTASPLYQWQLEEGTNALNQALRARGKYDSSAGLRAIGDFTRALGAEETEKYYNRLLDAINIGRGAATAGSQGAMQTGQNIGSTYMNLGNTLASTRIAQGEASAGFYSGLGGLPMNLASIYYLTKK